MKNTYKRLELVTQGLMEKYNIPGFSIATVKDRDVNLVCGFGVLDIQTQSPVSTKSRFQAASISKPVTAPGILRLVDEGKVSLDSDVNHSL